MSAATSARATRSLRWLPAVAVVAAAGVVAVRDPSTTGNYGFCPLLRFTGLDCPFCGGLRGTHDLLHGNLAGALDHNLLLPIYLGIVVMLVVTASGERTSRWFDQWRSGRGRLVGWLLAAVVLVFFVVRNLPWFPYLDSRA